MPSRPKRPRDPNQLAAMIVALSTGDLEDKDPNAGKDPAAIERGRAGGKKGGNSRARYVERQNLTMRMHMRRFTRLTNGFSKKVENHAYAVGLHYMFYNFAKIHKTLRAAPAMQAGLTDRVWSLEEIAKLAE